MTLEPYRASAVAVNGKAVLLEGPSGVGKSDLALRLISRGAILISDDYVNLKAVSGKLVASPPKNIAAKLEVRGIGIHDFPFVENIPVVLVISLAPREDISRMPEKNFIEILGFRLPKFVLHAFDASTPDKIFMLLA
ncbi:MAG: HPr kinase/phosphatase C-terminal domain-containing protein [Sphingomonadales bacterium]